MDFMKLLVAGQVNALAQTLRTADRARYRQSLNLPYDSKLSEMKADEWDTANPFKNYIKTAYRELVKTIELMDEAEAEYAESSLEEIAAGVRAGLEDKGQPGIPTVS